MKELDLGYGVRKFYKSDFLNTRKTVDYDDIRSALSLPIRYKHSYRNELVKSLTPTIDIALNRMKPHNSINALVTWATPTVAHYGSSYWQVTNNTGGNITGVTVSFVPDGNTIIGSYGTQYVDDITISRMESGETILLPFQFQMGTSASGNRIIGKPAKVTYTDASVTPQTAYTTNPIFIVCNVRPVIRSYIDYIFGTSTNIPVFYIQSYLPFCEIGSWTSSFAGIYLSYAVGNDTSIGTSVINTWIGTSGNYANILSSGDSQLWIGETTISATGMQNMLDPSTNLGVKPMALNENITSSNIASYYFTGSTTGYTTLFAASSDTTKKNAICKQSGSAGWLQLNLGSVNGGYFPLYIKDYALFASLITFPLQNLGYFTAEVTV